MVTGATSSVREQFYIFMDLVELLGKAPWANIYFDVNDLMFRRLVFGHLRLLIQGKEDFIKERPWCAAELGLEVTETRATNIVWITNRQQGKTSTLAKFVAALSLWSPSGGNLCCVYSTSLDRSQELTRAAKKYLYWLQSNDADVVEFLDKHGLQKPSFASDNERVYSVHSLQTGTVNTVLARPKQADSCRGDAPKCALFDEVAFVTSDFWYKFAFPLLQVGGRVFTCATTPAKSGTFFDTFTHSVKDRNRDGEYFFELINHSLVCAECMAAKQANKCVHRLGYVPPWKSLLRFENMKRLVPKKRLKDYETEVYGVLDSTEAGYFPSAIVTATCLSCPLIEQPGTDFDGTLYIGIDPPSHHRSSMGLVAAIYSNPEIIIVGASEVSAMKCESVQITMCARAFVRAVLKHGWLSKRRIRVIPIIECNNNEILSLTILNGVKSACELYAPRITCTNPFHADDSGVGVWTSEAVKANAISHTYSLLIDGRIRFAKRMACIGDVYKANHEKPTEKSVRETLSDQLKTFRDLPNGKISGKTDSHEDDVAMAFLLTLYWSHSLRMRG